MKGNKLLTFREMSESGQGHGGSEPQQLWRVPIYLRSREVYYQEAEESVRRRIEDIWELSGRAYGSREAFEKSQTVENMWGWHTPVWWGLNDIIGWIDFQLDPLEREFKASLFLPLKRISRTLKDKQFAFEEMERIPLPVGQTNGVAQELLIEAAERIAQHKKVSRYHVDLEHWKRMVRNTNLIGILDDFVRSLD